MSDFDPSRMDPNRPDMRNARYSARNYNWNWIIGGIAALVVLLVALSFIDRTGDQTAETPPATTTGQGTTTTPPATTPPGNAAIKPQPVD